MVIATSLSAVRCITRSKRAGFRREFDDLMERFAVAPKARPYDHRQLERWGQALRQRPVGQSVSDFLEGEFEELIHTDGVERFQVRHGLEASVCLMRFFGGVVGEANGLGRVSGGMGGVGGKFGEWEVESKKWKVGRLRVRSGMRDGVTRSGFGSLFAGIAWSLTPQSLTPWWEWALGFEELREPRKGRETRAPHALLFVVPKAAPWAEGCRPVGPGSLGVGLARVWTLSQASSALRNGAVRERLEAATFSGGPWVTSLPPPSPPSGPRSRIQSASAATAMWCSMTMTV